MKKHIYILIITSVFIIVFSYFIFQKQNTERVAGIQEINTEELDTQISNISGETETSIATPESTFQEESKENFSQLQYVDKFISMYWGDILLISWEDFKKYSVPNFSYDKISDDDLPYFDIGNYWVYETKQQSFDYPSYTKEYTESLYKSEVVDVIKNDELKASLISSFPCTKDTNCSNTSILKDNKYYSFSGNKIFYSLKNNQDIEINYDYPRIVLPIKNLNINDKWPLDKYDAADMEARNDNKYCSHVEDIINMNLYKKYIISYFTLPDQDRTEIVPGIGIVQTHYVHHGSIIESYSRLIDYKVK